MVLWFYGFMVLWFYGFMVLWFYGFMVLWFYGLYEWLLFGFVLLASVLRLVSKESCQIFNENQ